MNAYGAIFLLVTAVAVMKLPRQWAALPLLMGACYITPAQNFLIGPFHFTVLRLLLLLGVIRAMARHEHLPGGLNTLDKLIIAWGVVTLGMSVFHKPFGEVLVFRLGLVYNAFGMYFLIRLFCQSEEDLIQLIKITGFLLVPVALEMINEKRTGQNLFGVFFGGISEAVEVRDGCLRAQGPFGHSILGGTVGALCMPLMIGIWRQHRRAAMVGLVACLTMVITSKSSGPIMTLAVGAFALLVWRWRHLTRQMRIAAVAGYLLLGVVMKDPPYFLMARIDLTGSSTGWYRAQLIRSAFAHLNEWWFAGTDYTRHWMDTGLIVEEQADIVNHYLAQGVTGGLLLMGITIGFYCVGFYYVGQCLRIRKQALFDDRFLTWCLGSSLFASAVTCLSVSYFEQSVMILYLTLAAIGSLYANALAQAPAMTLLAPDMALPANEPGPVFRPQAQLPG